jgi:hypothetical protein
VRPDRETEQLEVTAAGQDEIGDPQPGEDDDRQRDAAKQPAAEP